LTLNLWHSSISKQLEPSVASSKNVGVDIGHTRRARRERAYNGGPEAEQGVKGLAPSPKLETFQFF